MIKPIEARRFELLQPIWDDATPPAQTGRKPRAAVDSQALREEVPAAKGAGVCDDLVERETDGRIVGGDDGARAHAHDAVEGHAVTYQPTKDAEVRRAAKSARAQNQGDAHMRVIGGARIERRDLHLFIGRSAERNFNLVSSIDAFRNAATAVYFFR